MTKCGMCEGKGYEQIQSCYDESHSRIECSYCMGDGIEIKDNEKQKEEIDKIDTCVEDKSTQIYEMSQQYEKLLDENSLLKKEIQTLKGVQ